MSVDFLITGGAGFIGCALATELLKAESGAGDARIIAVDCLHPQIHPSPVRPTALPHPVDLRVMNICEAEAWDRLLSVHRPRAIVHLAAETGTGQSLDLPTRHTHTNVTGTAVMLEAMDRARFFPEHVVLASSRAVYGEGRWVDPFDGRSFLPDQRTPEQLKQGQFDFVARSGQTARPLVQNHADTPPRPTSIYGATKLAQEHLLDSWCTARGVPLSILRLQNVYGVGQSPYNPYTGIIGLFHQVAASGGQIEVYEDGRIGRDFVYIDDAARCIAAALLRPPRRRRTLDVGCGRAMTVLKAAQFIADLYGAPAPQITGAFRLGDIRWAVCAGDDLEDDLGISPRTDFIEGNTRLSVWLRDIGVIR